MVNGAASRWHDGHHQARRRRPRTPRCRGRRLARQGHLRVSAESRRPQVKAVLVTSLFFGGIMSATLSSAWLRAAARQVKPHVPLVVRLEGTTSRKARSLEEQRVLKIPPADTWRQAARRHPSLRSSELRSRIRDGVRAARSRPDAGPVGHRLPPEVSLLARSKYAVISPCPPTPTLPSLMSRSSRRDGGTLQC